MEETFIMSSKELDRYAILTQVLGKKLKQKDAARLLKISDRQTRNLLSRLKVEGKKGVISKKRGKVSNNAKPFELRKKVLHLMRTKYKGFGPTFASEKLEELDEIKVNHETLRLWMIKENLWNSKEKQKRIHPPRERRSCFGELIQVDGSHHHWFGEDEPRCTLLVFIDDATSMVTAMRFCKEETVDDYFAVLRDHLKGYGIPRGIYSDRLKVFKGDKNLSQFQLALKQLGVESVLAYSPQAKGRVERVNRTLQDRLLKEMKLRGIKSREDGNQFIEEYLRRHNKKFSKETGSIANAHRPLEKGHDLERVLCRYEERTLSKDYTFQFHNRHYIISERSKIKRAKGVKVEVRAKNGKMRVFKGDEELKYKALDELYEDLREEQKNRELGRAKRKSVPKTHPWKRGMYKFSRRNSVSKV